MTDFRIIRNAPPLPIDGRGRGNPGTKGCGPKRYYPFNELQVGDAFDVPITEMWDHLGRCPDYNRLSANVSVRNRRSNRKFKVRMMPCGTIVRVRREA